MIEKISMVIVVFLVLVNFLPPGLSFALSVLAVYLGIARFDL